MNSKTKNNLVIRALKENTVEISGYVNAVERPSDVLFSKEHGGKFIERMMSGAFKKALSHNVNGVALLLNHDANLNYGSTKRGNLKLEEDNIGLRVNAIVEDEKFYKKAHNGELIGWSVGFYDRDVVEQRFEEWDLTTRKVYDLDLVEVSMLDRTKKPAYPGTQLNYRTHDVDGTQIKTWDIVPESVKYVGFEEQEKKERGENAMNENLEIRATSENEEPEEPMVKENKLPTEEEIRDMTEKAVDEKKFDLECEAQKILSGAENRDLTDTEISRLNELEKGIENLDKKFRESETARLRGVFSEQKNSTKKVVKSASGSNPDVKKERAFEDYLRSPYRRDGELVIGDAGALVPDTIANRILKQVYDLSPILQKSTRYNTPGKLRIPYYDETDKSIIAGYGEDFKKIVPSVGEFKSIELNNFLVSSLVLIGLQLISNTQFPIVDFLVRQMSNKFYSFIENEMLNGTEGKIEGLSKLENKITSAASNAITADEIIGLQGKVKDAYQDGAIWIMNPDTYQALQTLKDGIGRYLLQPSYDITGSLSTTLLNKPIHVSDNMPKMAGGKTVIYYGNMSGLAVKFSEKMHIKILNELYAVEHAVGICGFMEFDAKVQNPQAIAKLVMKA